MTENTTSTIKPLFLATAMAIAFTPTYINKEELLPNDNHEILMEKNDSIWSSNYQIQDYSFNVNSSAQINKISILESFIHTLAVDSLDIDEEIVELVNDNIWNLI